MGRTLVLALAFVLVNLPLVGLGVTDRALAEHGVTVTARVAAARTLDGERYVEYVLPSSVDPRARQFSARVDEAAFARASSRRAITVRVVPGHPGQNRPVGLVSTSLPWVVAIAGDLLLVVAVLGLRRRRRPEELATTTG